MSVSWIQHSLKNFIFILDRNLAKANCTENHVCTSCDKVIIALRICTFFIQRQNETFVNYTLNPTVIIKTRWGYCITVAGKYSIQQTTMSGMVQCETACDVKLNSVISETFILKFVR